MVGRLTVVATPLGDRHAVAIPLGDWVLSQEYIPVIKQIVGINL